MSGSLRSSRVLSASMVVPLLLSSLGPVLEGCIPPTETGQPIVVTPTATATPTATPVPSFDTGYRLTAMTVAESSSDALDLDGDGRPDNGIANALKELGNFLNDRIKKVLNDLLAAGTIDQQTYTAMVGASTAAIKAFFSVETVNQSLTQALTATPWVEHLYSTGPALVEQDFWTGEEHSSEYYLVSNFGQLTGDYHAAYSEVDTQGGTVVLDLALAVATSSIDMSFDLEDAMSQHYYVDGVQIQDGKLGGGISISALEDLVTEVLKKLGLLPFFSAQELAQLEDDLNDLLTGMADIELDSGEAAVSASLLYNAQPTVLLGEASPTPTP